ncbi:MAG: ABC transporter permease [Lachnospiraceae bacterium]|nr:ABC transporter permease [Lachnospiraceae bacterium]MDD3795104.1 ABC transporter permease [Lachnospiraceae bacterium]
MNNSKFSMKDVMKVKELGALLPLILLVVVASVINPAFMGSNNLFDILKTTSYTTILAVPLTMLMSSGRMDMSIAAATALGGIIVAMAETNGVPLPFAILLGILAGALIGVCNAILVDYFKLPGFIATLAVSNIVDGISAVVTNNNPIPGISGAFKAIAQTRLAGQVTITVVYALILAAAGFVVMNRMKIGRMILAVGGNAEAANLAGIDVKKIHTGLFILVGVFGALSGVLYCSRFSSAQLTAGAGTSLTIMSSVIIGGTAMRGGSGTIIGSVLGCMLFAVITNALVVMGISTNWQNVVYGLILVAALLIDYFRQKSARRA